MFIKLRNNNAIYVLICFYLYVKFIYLGTLPEETKAEIFRKWDGIVKSQCCH
jgi:hypothetical protein